MTMINISVPVQYWHHINISYYGCSKDQFGSQCLETMPFSRNVLGLLKKKYIFFFEKTVIPPVYFSSTNSVSERE